MSTSRNWVAIGAWMAALGVAAGAFGAHVLRDRVTPEMLAVYETAARYHLYHALGLLVVGLLGDRYNHESGARNLDGERHRLNLVGTLMLLGLVLFCGSLYGLALSGVRALGAITPFGGLCWIASWVMLANMARTATMDRNH